MAFEAGSLVRLKSSVIPVMTVASVSGDEVRCVWIEAVGKRHEKREETFPAVTLVPYQPPAPQKPRRFAISPRF